MRKLELHLFQTESVKQEFLQVMEVPFEWTWNSYRFAFGFMPVENYCSKLLQYLITLFK